MDNTLQLLIDSFWPLFKAGLTISVPLMLVSFILGLVVAFAVALMRMSKWKPLKAISWFYVWVIRGTPLIVQIFIIFFGLAYVGIILDPIPAAILALTISQGAYNSEVIRAALGSIPKGQNEACRALGLNKWQTMSRKMCIRDRDWAMQLHFAAQRDNNHRMHRLLGPDTGYDSIGPGVNLPALAAFLDGLDETGELPRTILYSLEPSDNAALVALMGCFQGPGTAGRLQHGSAWWFNDHKPGMEAQLTTLAAGGLLGNFIGMLTDSRSFLSYTRHEYFRRILCNLIGRWVEDGEFPDDPAALERLVAGISYRNSIHYFGFEQYHLRGADTV